MPDHNKKNKKGNLPSEPVNEVEPNDETELLIISQLKEQISESQQKFLKNNIKVSVQHLKNFEIKLKSNFLSNYQRITSKKFAEVNSCLDSYSIPGYLKKFFVKFLREMKN